MAGQIINRGKSVWLVRVFLGRNPETEREYHNKTVHGNKKDAEGTQPISRRRETPVR